jgi:hypothetical protein
VDLKIYPMRSSLDHVDIFTTVIDNMHFHNQVIHQLLGALFVNRCDGSRLGGVGASGVGCGGGGKLGVVS